MFGHRPGDRQAIEGGGAAADLIEQHQRSLAGVVQDVGGFGHLHHEGGLARGQIIYRPDPGEDSVRQADAGRAGRDPAADLGHQLQQPRLAQITTLAAGIGARQHEQIRAVSPQGQIVGGEALLHQQLLHHRMASRLDHQLAALHQLGPAVATGGGHLRQGGQGIQVSHQPGRRPHRGGLFAHLAP